jgi:hypothetical protein
LCNFKNPSAPKNIEIEDLFAIGFVDHIAKVLEKELGSKFVKVGRS